MEKPKPPGYLVDDHAVLVVIDVAHNLRLKMTKTKNFQVFSFTNEAQYRHFILHVDKR